MKVKCQAGAHTYNLDGNLSVELEEESGWSNTLSIHAWQRQVPKTMEIIRWGADIRVSEQQYSTDKNNARVCLKHPSVYMAEKPENENIECVGLRTF